MNLKDIFKEDITRPIEGVIKADDQEHLLQEVKEYVFTQEVKQKFARNFIEFYNDYTGVNGVWISGFFGSGKSHLLKMLSLLLENRELEGKTVSDYFIPKVEDEILIAEIKRAVRIPSKSILFNIDQKADIISKDQEDAVLSVFVKVFNEMQGYYPKLGHVAEFERDLDNEGLYEEFKTTFEQIAGKPWVKRRKRLKMATKQFAQALAKVKGISEVEASNKMNHYRQDYKVSIEYFANMVKDYLDKQAKGFRLNFFVDEVGQYISDNTKLMTNLQTIAESLATKCKGQAWVFVTSQEDMDAVIGGLKERQSNDFSKIQARFSCKINLTSGNVGEVIQKRLLDKNEGGEDHLFPIYKKEKNNLPTLFRFSEGGTAYRSYQNEGDFIAKYPFLPYQFNLFQEAIRGLSVQNAFHGKHQSVGERSMLGVFQDVVKDMIRNGMPLGDMASFDRMYDGIQSTLRGEIQAAIKRAESNLPEFQQRVLKVLFLVKYVKSFKPTLGHISILLIDNFQVDLLAHEKKIQAALNNLVHEIYIQRNGNLYEYLTNEEKDIENEIKREGVDTDKVNELLGEILFKNTIRTTKIRYQENKQDYLYTRKLDNAIIGREYELSLHIVTPVHEHYTSEHLLKAHSLGKSELLFVLPEDERLMEDLTMFLKIEKFFRKASSQSMKVEIRQILDRKKINNNELRRNLQQRIEQLIANARIYLDGQELDLSLSNAHNRVAAAFQQLINYAYPNLKMLKKIYTEADTKTILLNKSDDLFLFANQIISEAERELLATIKRNAQRGERSTVHTLLHTFKRRPYGWYDAGIQSILAQLFQRNKVEIKENATFLEAPQVLTNLTNNRKYEYTIIEPLPEIDTKKLSALKQLHRELFNETNNGKEAKEIGLKFKEKLAEEEHELQDLLRQQTAYPFLKILRPFQQQIKALARKNYHHYFEKIQDFEDDLLDFKEDKLDLIKNFMNGEQKKIYDNISLFVNRDNANFNYVEGQELSFLKNIKDDHAPYMGKTMQQAKEKLDIFKAAVQAAIEVEKDKATLQLEKLKDKIRSFPDFKKILPPQQERILDYFQQAIYRIRKEPHIGNIRDKVREFEDVDYHRHLAAMMRLAKPPKPKSAPPTSATNTPTSASPTVKNSASAADTAPTSTAEEPQVDYIALRRVKVDFKQPYLRTEEEVEEYIAVLRKKYLEVIRSNRGITL